MTPQFQFEIAISIEDRAGDLSLNDVPIFRNYDGRRADLNLPVTQWMVSGANRLKWDIFVDDESALEPRARARATLRATPIGRGEWRDLMTIAIAGPLSIETPPEVPAEATPLGIASAVTLGIDAASGIASVERQLKLTAPMPVWAWTSSPPIPDTPDVLGDLVRWYQGLHAALATGDSARIGGVLGEKTRELAAAFRMTEAEMFAEIGLAQVPADPEWRLSTPDWPSLMMERAADNRLVRLFHPRDGGVIVSRDETGLYRSFEFWLRRAASGWVMTR